MPCAIRTNETELKPFTVKVLRLLLQTKEVRQKKMFGTRCFFFDFRTLFCVDDFIEFKIYIYENTAEYMVKMVNVSFVSEYFLVLNDFHPSKCVGFRSFEE